MATEVELPQIFFNGSGGISNAGWGAIGGIGAGLYDNFITGDSESDLDESITDTLKGFSIGANFGPWGMLGGALYGLGHSFKDDLGIDGGNTLGKILFPIKL